MTIRNEILRKFLAKMTPRDRTIVFAMHAVAGLAVAAKRLHDRAPTKTADDLVAATPGFREACAAHELSAVEIAADIIAGAGAKAAVVHALAVKLGVSASTITRVVGNYQKSVPRVRAAAAGPSRPATAATTTARTPRARRP